MCDHPVTRVFTILRSAGNQEPKCALTADMQRREKTSNYAKEFPGLSYISFHLFTYSRIYLFSNENKLVTTVIHVCYSTCIMTTNVHLTVRVSL